MNAKDFVLKCTQGCAFFRVLLGIGLETTGAPEPRARSASMSTEGKWLLAETPHFPPPPQVARHLPPLTFLSLLEVSGVLLLSTVGQLRGEQSVRAPEEQASAWLAAQGHQLSPPC